MFSFEGLPNPLTYTYSSIIVSPITKTFLFNMLSIIFLTFKKSYFFFNLSIIVIKDLSKLNLFIKFDDEIGISEEGNIIFQSLEDMNISDITESNNQISSFLMDIIINIVQEYNDPLWIISVNNTKDDLQKNEIQKEQLFRVKSITEKLIKITDNNFKNYTW